MDNLNIDSLRNSLSSEGEKPGSLNEEKKAPSISIFQNICKNTKTSLSKLIQSVQNYHKLSDSVDKIKRKPSLIHNNSYRNVLNTFSKHKRGSEEIDENDILKTTTISTITSSFNNTNKNYIDKKIVDIPPISLIRRSVTKYSINNNNLSIDQLISLEATILILLNKTRNPNEFHIECKEWKNTFEKNILVFFKEYNFIKNRREEMKYSLNILIISLIIAYWRTNTVNLNNYNTFEIIIKEISEIMAVHHRIYLLLCLWIFQEYKYSLINNNENISFLKNQINKNLPRKMNNCRNIYLIIEELSSSCNILHSILKSILNENIDLLNDDNLLNNIDNLSSIEMIELIDYFTTLINEEEAEEELNEKDLSKLSNIALKDTNNDRRYNYSSTNLYNCRPSINNNCQSNYNELNKTQNYPIYYYVTDHREKVINENISNNDNINYINNINNYDNNNNNYDNNFDNNNNYDNYYVENVENQKPYIKKQIVEIPKPPFLKNINTSKYNQKKYTLILDLDETLVQFRMSKYGPEKGTVLFRPGLIQFLNRIYPLFDLVVWTVATKEYADFILDYIEKERKYFSARLYREHASVNENKVYVKNLLNLGRPLNTIIIVDDKESSYSLQKENGILIRPFYGTNIECQKDFVLLDLFSILSKIVLDKPSDVRNSIYNYRYEIQRKISNDLYVKKK